jgi:hypothetical protein
MFCTSPYSPPSPLSTCVERGDANSEIALNFMGIVHAYSVLDKIEW